MSQFSFSSPSFNMSKVDHSLATTPEQGSITQDFKMKKKQRLCEMCHDTKSFDSRKELRRHLKKVHGVRNHHHHHHHNQHGKPDSRSSTASMDSKLIENNHVSSSSGNKYPTSSSSSTSPTQTQKSLISLNPQHTHQSLVNGSPKEVQKVSSPCSSLSLWIDPDHDVQYESNKRKQTADGDIPMKKRKVNQESTLVSQDGHGHVISDSALILVESDDEGNCSSQMPLSNRIPEIVESEQNPDYKEWGSFLSLGLTNEKQNKVGMVRCGDTGLSDTKQREYNWWGKSLTLGITGSGIPPAQALGVHRTNQTQRQKKPQITLIGSNMVPNSTSVMNSDSKHLCKFCNLTFPTKKALAGHKRQHYVLPPGHVSSIPGTSSSHYLWTPAGFQSQRVAVQPFTLTYHSVGHEKIIRERAP